MDPSNRTPLPSSKRLPFPKCAEQADLPNYTALVWSTRVDVFPQSDRTFRWIVMIPPAGVISWKILSSYMGWKYVIALINNSLTTRREHHLLFQYGKRFFVWNGAQKRGLITRCSQAVTHLSLIHI